MKGGTEETMREVQPMKEDKIIENARAYNAVKTQRSILTIEQAYMDLAPQTQLSGCCG